MANDSSKVDDTKKESDSIDLLAKLNKEFLSTVKSEQKFKRLKFYFFASLFALGIVFYAASFAYLHFFDNSDIDGDSKDGYVAEIRVNGIISSDSLASARQINPLLEKAFSDKKAKGVVVVINSPGGAPVQSDLIRRKLITLREKHPDKDVLVYGEDMLTSGAYMIAVGSDKIYAAPSSIVGSIGVISQGFGFTGLMKKFGIQSRILTAGKNKAIGSPFEPFTKAAKDKLNKTLQRLHHQFISYVKTARRDKLTDSDVFTGEFWVGDEAAELGLIDGVGAMDDLLQKFFGTSKTKEIKPTVTLSNILKMLR